MELLDIVDENNNFIGRQEDRGIVHKEGLWHREVAIWIMNKKGEILVQKRSANKKQHPNKWAITAGHIDVGEEPIQVAIRETFEEIGLELKEKDLEFLFIAKIESNNNNHFKYIYFSKADKELSDFIIQKEELSEVKYISLSELEDIIEKNNKEYVFINSKYIPKVISILKNKEENL